LQNQNLEIHYPDHVWCGDITYIQLRRGFAYLAVLLEVFTRSIRGWELPQGLDDSLAIRTLEKALEKGKLEIHHSDGGAPYLSKKIPFDARGSRGRV